jgi:hypothetical protein
MKTDLNALDKLYQVATPGEWYVAPCSNSLSCQRQAYWITRAHGEFPIPKGEKP